MIRCKHSSIRTEEAYTNWVRRFILFHGKRPKIETIRMFLDRQELLGQTEIIGQQEEQGEALPPGAGRSAGSRLGNPTAPNALNHGCMVAGGTESVLKQPKLIFESVADVKKRSAGDCDDRRITDIQLFGSAGVKRESRSRPAKDCLA